MVKFFSKYINLLVLTFTLLTSPLAIGQINNNLNGFLKNIFTELNQANNKDSTLEIVAKRNPAFVDFSKNYEDTAKEIDGKLSLIAPSLVNDCTLKKFKFKNICLGITLDQFSKIYTLSSRSSWDAMQLKRAGIRVVDEISNRAERKAACNYTSPSVYTDEVKFLLPYTFRSIQCSTENETLLGRPTNKIEYLFINNRLYLITIEVMVSGLSNARSAFHEYHKDFYQKYFYEKSELNETISESIEEIQKSESGEIRLTKWNNQTDATMFVIVSSKSLSSIVMVHPEINRMVKKVELEVSNYNKNLIERKDQKDF